MIYDIQALGFNVYSTYRAGSLAFPAVRVDSFLLVRQSFGLNSEHPPLLAPHFLPPLAEKDADGSANAHMQAQAVASKLNQTDAAGIVMNGVC